MFFFGKSSRLVGILSFTEENRCKFYEGAGVTGAEKTFFSSSSSSSSKSTPSPCAVHMCDLNTDVKSSVCSEKSLRAWGLQLLSTSSSCLKCYILWRTWSPESRGPDPTASPALGCTAGTLSPCPRNQGLKAHTEKEGAGASFYTIYKHWLKSKT